MDRVSDVRYEREARFFVTACYRALLGRDPEAAGLAYYMQHFQKSGDYEELLDSFCQSDEFKSRQRMLIYASADTPMDYYYFFHIPKTAGLTVKAYLGKALNSPDLRLFPGVFVKDLLGQIEVIRQYAFFSGHFLGFLDALLGATTHKATILRDPVDRAISHYFHALRDPSLPLHKWIVGRPLAKILHDEMTQGFAVNYHAKYLAALVDDASWLEHTLHFRAWPKSDVELLEKARAGLALMEVVGLHEYLPDFFQRLAAQWPIRYSGTIPWVNAGDNREDQRVSAADRELLKEINVVDYALYQEVKDRLCIS